MRVVRESRSTYKKDAIKAAEELDYGPVVIKKLKKAKNEFEIARILIDARRSVV